MKKVFLIIIAVFVLSNAYSQTEKGKFYAAASLSLNNSNNEHGNPSNVTTYKDFTLAITPGIGYFIKDNFSLELSMGFLHYNNNYVNNSVAMPIYIINSGASYYSANLYACYYKDISEKFKLRIKGGFGYGYEVLNSNIDGTSTTLYTYFNNYSLGFSPGLVYFYNKHFAVNVYICNLNYSWYTLKDNPSTTNTHQKGDNINFDFNLSSLSFGLNYYF